MSHTRTVLFVTVLATVAGASWWALRSDAPATRRSTPDDRIATIPASPSSAPAAAAVAAPAPAAPTRPPAVDAVEFKAVVAPPGAPLPPESAAVADVFDALSARARDGDFRASCRLAAELQRCDAARITGQTAANIEGEVARSDRTPDAAVNQLARMQSLSERQGRGCAGLTDQHFRHAFDLQLQTALQVPEARLWFALNPALDPWNFVNDLERWTIYRQHAMPWLEEAAARGEPAALIALARVHGDLRRIGPPYPRFRIADEEKFLVYVELMRRHGIAFAPVTRDADAIRARLGAEALARIADRVTQLHRPERKPLSASEVTLALDASMRRSPSPGDCARLEARGKG